MKPLLIVRLLAVFTGCAGVLVAADPSKPEQFPSEPLPLVDFVGVKVSEAVRLLSEATGLNVVATPAAGAKTVDLRLRQVSVEQAVRTLCLTTGLWFRFEAEAQVVRILTVEEFAQGLTPFPETTTRSITLLYPKAELLGQQIAHLYGERVALEVGEQQPLSTPQDRQGNDSGSGGGGGGGSNNRNGQSGSSRGGSSSGSGGRAASSTTVREKDPLIADDLRAVATGDRQGAIDAVRTGTTALPPIYLFVNQTDNLITMRSRDVGVLDDIERLIRQLDRPTPQVLLQVRILAVQLGDDFRSTFDLQLAGDNTVIPGAVQDPANPFAAGSAGTLRNTGGLGNFPLEGGTAVYQFLTGNLRARIQLLATENRVSTVSSPLLMGAHARITELFVGEERLVVTGFQNTTTTTTSGTSGGVSAETARRNIGTSLQIVPFINADRTVDIALRQEISTVNPAAQNVAVIDSNGSVQNLAVDTVDQSRVEGSVVVGDAQTIAIGGLIREGESNAESKVPFLGDIPVLGWFFRRQVTTKSRTELIILITPLVISVPGEAAAVVERRLETLSLNPRLFDERPNPRYRRSDLQSAWSQFPLGLPSSPTGGPLGGGR